MIAMNRFELMGEVASAPETKNTNNGKTFVSFYVKADKEKSNGETFPNYYEMLVWSEKMQEKVKEQVIKGNPIFVEGSISSSAYTNRAGERKTSISLFLGNFATEPSKAVKEAPRDTYSVDSSDLPF